MENLDAKYLAVAKEAIGKMDEYLVEDCDLICQYLVIRYLKTSPVATAVATPEEQLRGLKSYIDGIYPFFVTFVMSANSLPFEEKNA